MVITLDQLKEQMVDPNKWLRRIKNGDERGVVFVMIRGQNEQKRLASFLAFKENEEWKFDDDDDQIEAELLKKTEEFPHGKCVH